VPASALPILLVFWLPVMVLVLFFGGGFSYVTSAGFPTFSDT
jgi:hypothetical protein